MPDIRKHRGPGPRDLEWFAASNVSTLVSATADLSWLLSRGYAEQSSLKLVGDRYSLVERQRRAVLRSSCSDSALAGRRSRCIEINSLRGQSLSIDGFNLILTIESALGGGVVLGGRDRCYRDLASVHGTYRRVRETIPALELALRNLTDWGVGPSTWLLDAPVSNSGRLAAMIRRVFPGWKVEVAQSPDRLLSETTDIVVTADSAVLDRCAKWANLAAAIIDAGIPRAFVVDLRTILEEARPE